MTETKIYQKLKQLFDKNNFGEITRIESGSTVLGIPDCYYASLKGCHGWIELKQTKQSKNGKIKIPYRPGQQRWLNFHAKLDLNIFVLLWLEGYFYLINKNFLIKEYLNLQQLIMHCCCIGSLENTLPTIMLQWLNGGSN